MGGGKCFEKCTEGVEGLCNILSQGSKIHRFTNIMVMMRITNGDRWVCYAKGYGVRSTGVGVGLRDVVLVGIFWKLLNYDVVRGERGALRV